MQNILNRYQALINLIVISSIRQKFLKTSLELIQMAIRYGRNICTIVIGALEISWWWWWWWWITEGTSMA